MGEDKVREKCYVTRRQDDEFKGCFGSVGMFSMHADAVLSLGR